MKIRLICVFFQGACDGNVKTSRNIARKSKNTEILNKKKRFFEIQNIARIDAPMYFFGGSNSQNNPKTQKHNISPIFQKMWFFEIRKIGLIKRYGLLTYLKRFKKLIGVCWHPAGAQNSKKNVQQKLIRKYFDHKVSL